MLIPRLAVCIVTPALLVLGMNVAHGQDYPNKPVRIVTSNVGGSVDLLARLFAPRLSDLLGQSIVIDNRPSGVIPGETVARGNPDGYTLLLAAGTLWVGPLLQTTPYDVMRDFSPVAALTTTTSILVVHPSLPARSVKELIALAKTRPGEINYASGATGSANHLAAELFKALAGVDIVRVPYKGGGPAINAVVSGEVQLTFSGPGSMVAYVKPGRLRALAVTGLQPSALAPGVPTIAASGLPGYEAVNVQGVLAPAKTPDAIIKRVNQHLLRVLDQPEVKQKILAFGLESSGSSPEEFAVTIKSEIARMGKVIKGVGIRQE